jgi:hypothetical protein
MAAVGGGGGGRFSALLLRCRLAVMLILIKYKYLPDGREAAVDRVLHQAKALGEDWG